MSQNWGGGSGGGGGWGQGGGYPPAGGGGGGGWGPPGGGYGPPGGAPPGGGGYGPPGGAPPGGGGYGPPGGAPPGGGGYGPPPPAGGGGNFAPPPPGYPPGYTPQSPGGVVAWEDSSRSFFARWWGTTKAVLFDSRNFYTGAAQNEDAMPAVTYSALSAGLGGLGIGITAALMYFVIGSIGAMAGSGKGGGAGGAAGMAAVMGAMGVAVIFIYPIMAAVGGFIGPWITGGIYHVTLMLFKGANKPYTSTVRVAGYAHAYYLWIMVPVFGYLIGWLPAMVFALIANIVGLDAVHKCGMGKAVGAVLLIPGILALCCCGAYASIIASAISSTHR